MIATCRTDHIRQVVLITKNTSTSRPQPGAIHCFALRSRSFDGASTLPLLW
ncbi:MAG: hypothetical protein ACK55Z_30895 [bacterium]